MIAHDASLDVTDWWQAATDPENARGEIDTALFDAVRWSVIDFRAAGHGEYRTSERAETMHDFTALTVEDTDEIRVIGRDECAAIYGLDTIREWEREMDERHDD